MITHWLCVCTLALHTFTLVLNPQTRVWLNCDLGTFKTRLWDLLRNRQQFSVVRGASLVIPGVYADPVFARQNRDVQVEQKHQSSRGTSPLAPWVPPTPSGAEGQDLYSVEWSRVILCLGGHHCLVFVFFSQIVKLLWVMSASGVARSKHGPECRSAVCVRIQMIWSVAEGGWEKSRLYQDSCQT